MKLKQCNGLPEIYAWLEGVCLPHMSSLWHGFMCILLYMKLIWCNGFPEIMLDWRRGSICQIWTQYAFCYIWNLFGVMVLQRSMLDWRRGWGQSVMKLMQCTGLPEIYAQLWGVHLPNMSTLWNLLLLHRGLFYERPIRTKRSIYMNFFILILFVVVLLVVVVVHV